MTPGLRCSTVTLQLAPQYVLQAAKIQRIDHLVCHRRASLPVVTAAFAAVVKKKVPSRHEGLALILLTGGVCLTISEGTAKGNVEGLLLAIGGSSQA